MNTSNSFGLGNVVFSIGRCHRRLRLPIVVGAVLLVSFHFVYAGDGPVAAVQEALKKRQFYSGEITGKLDEPTREGLQRFQVHAGLPDTGEMDSPTLEALQGAPPLETPAPSRSQSDHEFLEQVEKGSDGATPPAPPVEPVVPVTPAPPASPAPAAPPATAQNIEDHPTVQTSPAGDQKPQSKSEQKSPRSHPIPPHAKTSTVEIRSQHRKQKLPEGSNPAGALEARGSTSRPREHLVQPTIANLVGPPVPEGSKATTASTTIAVPNGQVRAIEKKATPAPRVSKPFLQLFFGANNSANRADKP